MVLVLSGNALAFFLLIQLQASTECKDMHLSLVSSLLAIPTIVCGVLVGSLALMLVGGISPAVVYRLWYFNRSSD